MKALLMAAGKGTRISRYIEGKPKYTVDIGDTSLIEYTINELLKHDVDEIAVVLGYHSEEIKAILEKYDIKYNGSVVKTKIKDFYNELISMVLGG